MLRLRFFMLLILMIPPTSGYSATSDPMSNVASFAQAISKATNNKLHLSGYFNGHIMEHDGPPVFTNKNLNEPFYQLREASIFADLNISDSILFSTELELSYDFTDGKNTGRKNNLESVLNYYYIEWDISNQLDLDSDETGTLKVRFGRILVPFLQYNENKPSFSQNLMSQPYTAWQIAPVNNVATSYQQFGWGDKGVSINWNYFAEDAGIFDIKFSVINGLGSKLDVLDSNTIQLNPPSTAKPTVRPRDGLFNAKSEWDSFADVNHKRALVLKTSFIPNNLPINIGISLYKGAWDKDGKKDLRMYGFHFGYNKAEWKLKGEYLVAKVEQEADINVVSAPGPIGINISTGNYEMKAWYVEGAYRWLQYGPSNSRYFSTIIRLDDVTTNNKTIFSPFNRSRITLGIEWQFIRNIRLRAEVQRSDLKDFGSAPGPYIAAGGKDTIDMKMLSLIAYF